MSQISDRYRLVAGTFTARAREVPDDGWERPAPCEGWTAKDVVGHLVEWVPGFFAAAGGPDLTVGVSVDDNPVVAWTDLTDRIQALLDDPGASATLVDHPRVGAHRFDDAVAMFVTPDVLVHTWDLARAVGLDESLDSEVVHDVLVRMEPFDEVLRASGHYGTKVPVPADADEQTRLIAFTGRRP